MSEAFVQLQVDGETLHGIAHRPEQPGTLGVVCLHGWSGSRVGPHRIFVEAARGLVQNGVTVFRFDFRGRGDSGGDATGASIPGMVEDAMAAVTWMRAQPGIETVILLGICSGGKVAVCTAAQDARVDGLALWSAEPLGSLHGAGTDARKSIDALKTYARKLTDLGTWKKIVSGQVRSDLVKKALVDHEAPSDEELQAEESVLAAFAGYRGSIFFVYGGGDPATADAAANYGAFCETHDMSAEFHEIPDANHSFYSLAWKAEVLTRTEAWLMERS